MRFTDCNEQSSYPIRQDEDEEDAAGSHSTCFPNGRTRSSSKHSSKIDTGVQGSLLPWSSSDNHDEDFTLGDILDFSSRKKVADLMAIAPGLPIWSLHNLLLDVEGDLAIARGEAIKASQATPHPSVKHDLTTFVSRLDNATHPNQDSDSSDVMVKLDPNEAYLEWDDNTPPPMEAGKKKPHSRKSAVHRSRLSNFPNIAHHSQRESRETKLSPQRDRRARGNSITKYFIVPDNVVHLDTDGSSSESDTPEPDSSENSSDLEMLDYGPEDVDELRTDMRSRYAYNARILDQRGTSDTSL
ncbi:hypothetical protein GQ44DRAFT_212833 [Phaeosphaeriaceae sp. PMI808]|nr:hypothetical protein GQ44DRAFT_212833 [Phaeosphaeriaceae sp. PMI808]